MPRGDKGAYTDKQKRKAEHIEESYEERGVSSDEAAARAWATVNKESGGGKKEKRRHDTVDKAEEDYSDSPHDRGDRHEETVAIDLLRPTRCQARS